MSRILIAIVVIGGVLVFKGVQEMRLASVCKADPSTITCADLVKNGCGDNAHIIMKDFIVSPGGFVYETKKNSETYAKVWVPLVPIDSDYGRQLILLIAEGKKDFPAPTDVKVLLKSTQFPDDASMKRLFFDETVQGLVINKTESLGRDERKILEESYPNANFDSVYILEHDRKPSSSGASMGMVGGGGVLGLAGIGGFLLRRKSGQATV